MADALVICGGASGRPTPSQPVLRRSIGRATAGAGKVGLNLDQLSRTMAADVPGRLTDLVEIATYVYAADQSVERGSPRLKNLGADWRRRLAFRIPVRDLDFWRKPEVKETLSGTLAFLSEDDYRFEFVTGTQPPGLHPYLDFESSDPPSGFVPDRVLLFSGGLDSASGAVEALLGRRERAVLVSHRSSPMIANHQLRLVDALRQRAGPGRLLSINATVTLGGNQAVEFTQRSRSFLFAVLGFVVARMFGRTDISFYENGIVSLNLPLAEHILGSRSTRTTHPRVLAGFAKLFSLVSESDFSVANPFFWMTKRDVVRRLMEAAASDLIAQTFSCTRVRQATKTGRHCGSCSQCLDRRFAILAAGAAAAEPASAYEIDLFLGERKAGPNVTLAESFILAAQTYRTASEMEFLSRHGEIFRALPFLDGKPAELVARLHQMHRRHGEAVCSVVDQFLVQHHSLALALGAPETSLLSLVASQAASAPDADEGGPNEDGPVRTIRPQLPTRPPIAFGVDEGRKVLLFDNGAEIVGPAFRLMRALLPEAREDWEAGSRPANHRWVSSDILAERLRLDEPGVRQAVKRARRDLARLFADSFSTVLAIDDFVENGKRQRASGYRLNPQLVLRPAAYFTEAGPTDESR